MTELKEMIEDRVATIREAALDNLRSASWLEHELLPQLGLHGLAREYLPKDLGPHCNAGLQSYQAPNQFSKYLAHLATRKISNYLELGAHMGGTFIITIEYLSRFSDAPVHGMAIDQSILPPLRAYQEMRGNVDLLSSPTNDQNVAKLIRRRFWDLALIDADHTEAGCSADFALMRDNAKLVAFHDIYNDVCPYVEVVWKRLLRVVPRRCTWEFSEQYVEMLRTRNQRLFGIGLVELGQ